MPARKAPPPGRADSSLTALLSANVTLAQSLTLDAETLERWYAAQLAAVEARYAKLAGLVEANHAKLGNLADPNWPRWFLQVARMEYVEATLALLRERKHCLVCPTHGVEGVSEDEWATTFAGGLGAVEVGGEIIEGWYEALSLHGLVTGEGAAAWSRYCTDCAKPGLEQRAARLQLAHAGEAAVAPQGLAVAAKACSGGHSAESGENEAPAGSQGFVA